jgi:hypothetical protein
MGEKNRGEDAQDHAPQPAPNSAPADGRQDAPNYKERTDKGEAIQVEDLNSANDEGAA